MTALYREFPLRSESGWTAIVAFLRGNAKAVWERGKFLRIIITEDENKRSSDANRFYWGVVLTMAERSPVQQGCLARISYAELPAERGNGAS